MADTVEKQPGAPPAKRARRRVRFYVPSPLPRHAHHVRNVEASNLLERFFVSAVVAVLVIRAWLGLTGFFVIGFMLSLLIFTGEAVRDAFDPRKAFT